ncbi:XdhC family protein [Hyphomicrobium sp.]|uniref:XdhC family protein n=1 Tax=Hyphomicrobium sp. TaxID=82 RepID=UPI000F939C10|nr:XdhC family protein [Hyphomicrobium sp.]RUP07994.1 MAG: XdhC family protein [Hyphomicrobium sp.]
MQTKEHRTRVTHGDFKRALSVPGLLADEEVLAPLLRWLDEGQEVALVTLVEVHGGAPREPGSQMAVAGDGRYAGYLSGGCLEMAVVLEAKEAIAEGRNRLTRYGRGSPYFDVRLPCGSGLDLYFDRAISREMLTEMLLLRRRRRPFALRTNLSSGLSQLVEMGAPARRSGRDGHVLERFYVPDIELNLIGGGPSLVAIAVLAHSMGVDLSVMSHDEATLAALAASGVIARIQECQNIDSLGGLDFASGAVLCFHDHDAEIDLLSELLHSKAFYIGALGNHAVHRERLSLLARRGFTNSDLSRIRGPIGVISGAKSKATLAVGVLAEVLAEAKACNLVP